MSASTSRFSQPEERTWRSQSLSRPTHPATTATDPPVNHARGREQIHGSSSSCSQHTALEYRTSISSNGSSNRARRPSNTSSSPPLSFVESYLTWSIHYQLDVTTQHPVLTPQTTPPPPPPRHRPDQQTHVPEPEPSQLPRHMRESHPHFYSPTESATRRLFPDPATATATRPITPDQYRQIVASGRFDIETGIGLGWNRRTGNIPPPFGQMLQPNTDAVCDDAAQQTCRSTMRSVRARTSSSPVKAGGLRAKCAHIWRSTRLIRRKSGRVVGVDDADREERAFFDAHSDDGKRSKVKQVLRRWFHVK